jgi:transposase
VSEKTSERPAKMLADMRQTAFCFDTPKGTATKEKREPILVPKFREGHPEQLFVGNVKLSTYLKERKFGFVLGLGIFFQGYDFSSFVKAYSPEGRPAIHPRVILGLIIYGILMRQSSLRELENLSLRDVGAWWICGGLQPDHSTIGKFLNQHSTILSEDFFGHITQRIVRELKLSPTDIAMDGTVIEAAASRYKVLKAEAALEAAKQATAQAKESPEDSHKQAKAERFAEVVRVIHEKQTRLEQSGKPAEKLCVSTTEPDAIVQPLKNKTKRPSYKPSILVDESRLIIGSYFHSTNENIAVAPMLEQHRQIYGQLPQCTLLDAGYHNIEVLNHFIALELDVLCPQGSVDKTNEWTKQSHAGLYPKSAFKYDEARNVYVCPQQQQLLQESTGQDGNGRRYTKYKSVACLSCPVAKLCTKSENGRSIKRYDGEAVKDAMVQVLQNPKAQQRYRKRKAIVEPVFAELKERQGLTRFHRKGTSGAKLEFALHCVAYNLKRAFNLSEGAIFGVSVLYCRRDQGPWKIIGIYFSIIPR